jgi:hypothetical protein
MRRLFFAKFNLLFWAFVLVVGSASTSLAANPSISGFTPKKGSVGDNIIINGEGFVFANLSSNTVRFSGKRAVVAVAPTANQLVVTVPDGAIPGRISVVNSNGQVDSNEAFEVIATSNQIASSGSAPGPGDRKELDTFINGFMIADGSSNTVYYAPPEAILWIDTKKDNEGYVTVHFVCGFLSAACDKTSSGYVKPESGLYKDGNIVDLHVEYKIEASKLQNYPAQSRGMDYGLLVVPFKFHLSDQSVTGEATLGGYAGYQLTWPGIAISTVLSAGVGVVNLTKQANGVSTESNAASFTAAGGFIINLMKSGLFQIGILCGFDWAGKGSQYKYEGKPWIAVSFGTNFTK